MSCPTPIPTAPTAWPQPGPAASVCTIRPIPLLHLIFKRPGSTGAGCAGWLGGPASSRDAALTARFVELRYFIEAPNTPAPDPDSAYARFVVIRAPSSNYGEQSGRSGTRWSHQVLEGGTLAVSRLSKSAVAATSSSVPGAPNRISFAKFASHSRFPGCSMCRPSHSSG